MPFSSSQRKFWLQWHLPAAFMHCLPGAGKTKIIMCFVYVLAVLLRDAPVSVVITEPSKVMCYEVTKELASFVGDRTLVARIGFDSVSGRDHWECFMDESVEL